MSMTEDLFERRLGAFAKAVGTTALIVAAAVLIGWLEFLWYHGGGMRLMPPFWMPPLGVWWIGLIAFKFLDWILIAVWLVSYLWLRFLRGERARAGNIPPH